MLNYFTQAYTDLARGLDTRSVANLIADGFSQQLINTNTNSEGHVEKRKGYQGFCGYVPLRAEKVEFTSDLTGNIIITFNGAVDFSATSEAPIIVSGILGTSGMAGDFSSSAVSSAWYETYTLDQPVSLPAGSGTESWTATESGISSNAIAVGIAQSTGSGTTNSWIFPDDVSVDEVSYQIDIDYTNGTGSTVNGWIFFKDKTASAGSVYSATLSGVTSVSVPASTHLLDNYNIVPIFEELTGGEYVKIFPDTCTVNSSTGQVDATFSSAVTGRIILTAAPLANVASGTIGPAGSATITVTSPGSPFNFVSCWEESGSNLSLCVPDAIDYDVSTDTMTVTFVSMGVGANLVIYWENAEIKQNAIRVTGTVSVTGVDNYPEICVWGVDQSALYPNQDNTAGHVVHLDSYKTANESRLVCGLGGNLFEAKQASEIGTTVAPLYYIDLKRRAASDLTLAPLFQLTGTGLSRSRGTVEGDNVLSFLCPITSVAYNSGTGYVNYTLTPGNKAVYDAAGAGDVIGNVISTTSNLEDWLTVTNMPHSRLNGTFKIKTVSETSTTIVIAVENSDITTDDFDDSSTYGSAGIFTDIITCTASISFEAEDSLVCGTFSTSSPPEVVSVSTTSMVVSNINDTVYVVNGANIYGDRTSDTFPLRTSVNSGSVQKVDYLVPGDMLSVVGYDRLIRIDSIDTSSYTVTLDEAISLADTLGDTVYVRPSARWYPVEAPVGAGDLVDGLHTYSFDANDYVEQTAVRSTMMNNNLYLTNGYDEVLKFDGDSIYRAGLPKWKPALFATLNTGTTALTLPNISATVAGGGISGAVFTLPTPADAALFSPGNVISHSDDAAIYTVLDTNTTGGTLTVNKLITGAIAGTVDVISQHRYYFKLYAIDSNDNVVASAVTSTEDFRVQLTEDCVLNLRLVGFPAWDIYDWDRIEVHTYRTKRNLETPFYLVNITSCPFDNFAGYVDIVDGVIDDVLTEGDLDAESSALLGNDLALNWDNPPKAKYITSAANRLLFANLTEYPKWEIALKKLRNSSNLPFSTLCSSSEARWLFRKSSSDTATDTDMEDRIAYEFVNAGAVTINPAADIANNAGVSFTITSAAHGLVVGDWVYLFHAAAGTNNYLQYAGWFQVYSKNAGDFTCKLTHATGYTPGANDVNRYVCATAKADVPVWLGVDGNYAQRDSNPGTGDGSVQAMVRFANAVNASQRMTDLSISAMSSFEPWLMANSGSEYGLGKLTISQPKHLINTSELVLASSHGTSYQVFVNGILRVANEQVSTSSKLFPSKVTISYENYPEIFDPTNSINVNEADGQEITGIIPFFGESAFGNAQREALVVVFKTDSIYLLDVSTVAVQKIESQGVGCTYPWSIASTRNGIMFANRSGIYRLNHDLTVSYAGKMLEGFWKEDVNRDETLLPSAHHNALDRRYELSVPVDEDSENDQVAVYDYTREGKDQEFGAWSTWTNFQALGWANLENDAFFATSVGQVYSMRRLGDSSDFRDDDAAISQTVVLKPMSFGAPGIRHKLRDIISQFKVDTDANITLSVSVDSSSTYSTSSNITLSLGGSGVYEGRDIVNVRSSVPYQKFNMITLKYVNSEKDQNMIISGVNFTVAPLTAKLIQSAVSSITV